MRPYGNTTPANYNLPDSPLIVGLDSLYMGFYGEVRPRRLQGIINQGRNVQLDKMPFKLKVKDRGVYRMILDNELMNLMMDNRLPGFSSPSVYAQMKSGFILGDGLIPAYDRVWEIMNWLYERRCEGEKVSRADLFADFDWPMGFDSQDVHKFVTRARRKHAYVQGNQLSGFTVGRGRLMARLYDKTLEIPKSQKEWLYELWGVDREAMVWRIEFQLRREGLKRFDVEGFSDLLNLSQPMWDYLTGEWLTMRDGDDKNISRRPLTPFWQTVQRVRFDFEDMPTVAIPVMPKSGQTRTHLTKQIAGLVRSYAKRKGHNPGLMLESLLPDLRRELER